MNFRRSLTVAALHALLACFISGVALLATIYRTWIPAIPLTHALFVVFYILVRRLSFPTSLYPTLVGLNRVRIRNFALAMLAGIAVQGYLAYHHREPNSWSWIPTPDYSFSLLFFVKATLFAAVFGVLLGIGEVNAASDKLQKAEREQATNPPAPSASPVSVPLI